MVRRFRRLTAGLARAVLAGLCLARFAPSLATTPDLVYYGGPVVSHARIVPVNWNSNVDTTLQAGLPQFYSDLTQSHYWDLLAQYSTAGLTPPDALPGSGQLIARGSVNAAVTIDPAVCHGKPCIRGLRYPVEMLLELLSSGMSNDDVLADYEDLERDDLLAALAYAARLTRTKRIQPVGP